MGKTSKSFVWDFFDRDSHGFPRAVCHLCKQEYQTSGNTSNLIDHLKRAHNITQRSQNLLSEENNNNVVTRKRSLDKLDIKEMAEQMINPYYRATDKKKIELDRLVVKMIATDMQPFSVVTDTGFSDLIHKLDPRYKLPSKSVVKERLLPEVYLSAVEKLREILSSVHHVALTTDSWTSKHTTESFLTVTCHFIYNYELRSYVLDTNKLGTGHTAENLSNEINDVIARWELTGKVVCIVTDNEASIVAAVRLLNVDHLPCFAHTLNLTVQDSLRAIPQLQELLTKCREIVATFKRSSKATAMLKKEQEDRHQPLLKLIQDVSTRWNSVLYMIQRLLLIGDPITVTLLKLQNSPGYLNANDKLILEEIKTILEPFEAATQKISGEFVTSSLIVPTVKGLYIKMQEIKTTLTTQPALEMWTQMINSMNQRLLKYESSVKVTKIAALLDPRFHKQGFKNKEKTLNAQAIIQTELQVITNNSCRQSTEFEPQPSTSTSKNSNFEGNQVSTGTKSTQLFGYIKQSTTHKALTPTVAAKISLQKYMELDELLDLEKNPLEFWKTFSEKNLTTIACKYLSIPGSSVPAERLFSKSGELMQWRRSRLKPKNINMLLFLNYNKKYD